MISVRSLTKRYGAVCAVDQLSFEVARGEVVGFLGPNGAGKTTTIRMLTGALAPTEGTVHVEGHDVRTRPARVKECVGYLPEAPPLYLDMSVRGYVHYCGQLKGLRHPDEAVERTLARLDLQAVADRIVGRLSKGVRQRVGLAQAIVHDPRLLVLDEPSSGLDPAQRVEFRALLKGLAAGDTTVLLSSHILSEVEAVCDRVLIVHEGKLVGEESIASLGETSSIRVQVRRPMDDLSARLAAVSGVVDVRDLGEGRFVVASSMDVREPVAEVLAPCGLLELAQHRALEERYLAATQRRGSP